MESSKPSLKALVTERNLVVEMKGIDIIQYRNCARLAIASNEDWVVPAGSGSRRWLVLQVSDARANDEAYFDALHKQLDDGGYEAMMYELFEREITSNLKKAPETKALQEQRAMYSAGDNMTAWVYNIVTTGNLPVNDPTEDSLDAGWPAFATTNDLVAAYMEFTIAQNGKPRPANMATQEITKLGFERIRKAVGNSRPWLRSIPTRQQLAANLKKIKGVEVEIDDNEI